MCLSTSTSTLTCRKMYLQAALSTLEAGLKHKHQVLDHMSVYCTWHSAHTQKSIYTSFIHVCYESYYTTEVRCKEKLTCHLLLLYKLIFACLAYMYMYITCNSVFLRSNLSYRTQPLIILSQYARTSCTSSFPIRVCPPCPPRVPPPHPPTCSQEDPLWVPAIPEGEEQE